jgi:hypothetical protein
VRSQEQINCYGNLSAHHLIYRLQSRILLLLLLENRVLRRIFGPKKVEVAGGWRKLHNEELHNLYFSSNIN